MRMGVELAPLLRGCDKMRFIVESISVFRCRSRGCGMDATAIEVVRTQIPLQRLSS